MKKMDKGVMCNVDVENESKQEIVLSLPKCSKMPRQVKPVKDPSPSLVVEEINKCEGRQNSTYDSPSTATIDKSASGEKQSLVLNTKDTNGVRDYGKGNSDMLRNLKKGVSDIAKVYAEQDHREEEGLQEDISCAGENRKDELQDNQSRAESSTTGDTESCIRAIASWNMIEDHTLQADLDPDCIELMDGCNSCSHINKGTSREPTSNSQTQTVNQYRSSTATNTNNSMHRTCSSQTATETQNRSAQSSQTTEKDKSNSSSQTTRSQTTQICQITPEYKTSSSQTSITKSNNIRRIVIKPWAARKYQDMCMCAELGAPCTCASRKTSPMGMVIPRNSSWWPTLKKSLLIIAAIIPWVFLIVYSIYYFRRN